MVDESIILKTWLIIEPGESTSMDTIMHESHFWLVPAWLDIPNRGITSPERMIRLTGLNYEAWQVDGVDLRLYDVVPRSVIYGSKDQPKDSRFEIRFGPKGLQFKMRLN